MCHDFSAKASVTLNFLKRRKRTRKEKRVLRAEPEFQYEHLGRTQGLASKAAAQKY